MRTVLSKFFVPDRQLPIYFSLDLRLAYLSSCRLKYSLTKKQRRAKSPMIYLRRLTRQRDIKGRIATFLFTSGTKRSPWKNRTAKNKVRSICINTVDCRHTRVTYDDFILKIACYKYDDSFREMTYVYSFEIQRLNVCR